MDFFECMIIVVFTFPDLLSDSTTFAPLAHDIFSFSYANRFDLQMQRFMCPLVRLAGFSAPSLHLFPLNDVTLGWHGGETVIIELIFWFHFGAGYIDSQCLAFFLEYFFQTSTDEFLVFISTLDNYLIDSCHVVSNIEAEIQLTSAFIEAGLEEFPSSVIAELEQIMQRHSTLNSSSPNYTIPNVELNRWQYPQKSLSSSFLNDELNPNLATFWQNECHDWGTITKIVE